MTRLERELLRLYVEAERSGRDTRVEFERLVSTDRVVLDLLWWLCFEGEQ